MRVPLETLVCKAGWAPLEVSFVLVAVKASAVVVISALCGPARLAAGRPTQHPYHIRDEVKGCFFPSSIVASCGGWRRTVRLRGEVL